MYYLRTVHKNFSEYFDTRFFIKFVLLYLVLYYFTYCYIALSDEKGLFYSPFLHQHYINYVTVLENAIINTANFFAHGIGLRSVVMHGLSLSEFENPPILKIDGGASVILSNGCLGLGIMSFWTAFIVANKGKWQQKLLWCCAGLLVIFLLNCCRITFLLFALQHQWKQLFTFIDHHTLFNLISYTVIFLMISLYNKHSVVTVDVKAFKTPRSAIV